MSCCILGCQNRGPRARKDITYHLFPHPVKDVSRCKQWIAACNNPGVRTKAPMIVYKRYRICRRHFDSSSMNGGCRRLLKTAIPTLHLNLNRVTTQSAYENEVKNDDGMEIAHVDVDNLIQIQEELIQTDDSNECYEFVLTNNSDADKRNKNNLMDLKESEIAKKTKSKIVPNQKYLYLDKIHERHKLKVENQKILVETATGQTIDNEDMTIALADELANPASWKLDSENEYELLDVEENKYDYRVPLSENTIKKWRDEFFKCEKNILAQNVCTRWDPFEVCLSRKSIENTQHVFTYKVESEGKPLTNQKNSGRCWIFAALNSIRIPFMKQYNLDEFEFSQGYVFYWDKIERCHYFLNNIIETAIKGEEVTGRLVSFLLNDPTCDGGQWDMLVNLINKHGLMPKKCFPESYSCEASLRLNAVLKSKLREYTKVLRDLVAKGVSEDEIRTKLNEQMGEIYKVVGICLGIPDEKFKWEYYDKSKAYQCVGPIKPTDFYEKYVKPCFNVDDKVCIVTDPRSTSAYGQAYTVEYLGNVVGGRPVLYNNQPVELLMDLVTTSLKNSEAVWFGCEVSKRFAGKQGIEDLTIHDFKLVFGVDIQITMSKADRLLYGESAMTHAMTFTAVSCDDNGTATKFRVENSWGEDRGEKGYLIMSADWFKEFVFEVVVDKSIVPKEVLQVFEQNPVVLPAWDPMGTLAIN